MKISSSAIANNLIAALLTVAIIACACKAFPSIRNLLDNDPGAV